MSKSYPYKRYENDEIWHVLEKGIKALVKNGDLEEKTARSHIIGYLTQILRDAGVAGAMDHARPRVIELKGNEEVIVRRVAV